VSTPGFGLFGDFALLPAPQHTPGRLMVAPNWDNAFVISSRCVCVCVFGAARRFGRCRARDTRARRILRRDVVVERPGPRHVRRPRGPCVATRRCVRVPLHLLLFRTACAVAPAPSNFVSGARTWYTALRAFLCRLRRDQRPIGVPRRSPRRWVHAAGGGRATTDCMRLSGARGVAPRWREWCVRACDEVAWSPLLCATCRAAGRTWRIGGPPCMSAPQAPYVSWPTNPSWVRPTGRGVWPSLAESAGTS
jgi:hypothetical protein